MIRVGLVTTISTEQKCGIAEYSRMMTEAMPQDIQITQIGGPYDCNRLLPRVLAGGYDIVHFNYESGFLGIFAPGVARKFGPRLILTLHDSWPTKNRENYPFTAEFDRVVIHQETNEGFVYIPHGIPVLKTDELQPIEEAVGTAGFPLAHKGIQLVAFAAALLKWGCKIICPESPHVDTHVIERQVKGIFPNTYYEKAWLPQLDVMKILSSCEINIFPYRNGKPGISAAVRMGLGTGSYMVLTKSNSFMDLWDNPKYADEIEWVEGDADTVTPKQIARACQRVVQDKRRPKKILEDMAWPVVAAKYAELYRGLM